MHKDRLNLSRADYIEKRATDRLKRGKSIRSRTDFYNSSRYLLDRKNKVLLK